MTVTLEDLRETIAYVVGAEPNGIALSILTADLRSLEAGLTKIEIVEALDRLATDRRIHATGRTSHGTRRYHPGVPS